MTTFSDLKLIDPILDAVADQGYTEPSPIQERAIPPLLEGKDVLGVAQTGTGKTAAFLLPVIQKLALRAPAGKTVVRALILTPTRELAAQIGESFEAYSEYVRLRHHVIFGGVSQQPQVSALRRGLDVLIATPGRLLDLHGQGHVDLSNVDFFVLDEADRMLDMGFIHDIRRVLRALPGDQQNLLFSATMPSSIVKLASSFLHDPIRVEVDRQSTTVEQINQMVMFVAKEDKKRLLRHLLDEEDVDSAIVFTRTKHGANRVAKQLSERGVEAAAIHGNKSQNARTRALNGFRDGAIQVLVATDIASRGIDVDGVSHVFNYDLPNEPESYVHRIGRTGRAGRDGMAIAFCDDSEREYLRDIEKLTGTEIERVLDHDWHSDAAMNAAPEPKPKKKKKRRRPNHGGGQSQRASSGSNGQGQQKAGSQKRAQSSQGGPGRSSGGASSGHANQGESSTGGGKRPRRTRPSRDRSGR